jgi:hypothetical protein
LVLAPVLGVALWPPGRAGPARLIEGPAPQAGSTPSASGVQGWWPPPGRRFSLLPGFLRLHAPLDCGSSSTIIPIFGVAEGNWRSPLIPQSSLVDGARGGNACFSRAERGPVEVEPGVVPSVVGPVVIPRSTPVPMPLGSSAPSLSLKLKPNKVFSFATLPLLHEQPNVARGSRVAGARGASFAVRCQPAVARAGRRCGLAGARGVQRRCSAVRFCRRT